MSDFNVGDYVRVTRIREDDGNGHKVADVYEGYVAYLSHGDASFIVCEDKELEWPSVFVGEASDHDDVEVIAEPEPPVVTFVPGDVVEFTGYDNADGKTFRYLITKAGYINLSAPDAEVSYENEAAFTSKNYRLLYHVEV